MIGYQLGINAERRPEAIATVFGDRRLTYAALNDRANRAAKALRTAGVAYGDRIAVLTRNCDDFVVLLFATAKIGAIFVPVNFRLAPREIARVIAHCRPSLLFCGTSQTASIAEIGTGAGTIPINDELPRPPGRDAFDAWLSDGAPEEPRAAVKGCDIQMLLHSSGTTGEPKGAIWFHSTTWASCATKTIDFGLGPDDATVVFGPLFHAGPLLDLALPILLRGGRLVIGASTEFDPELLLRTAAEERVTVMTIYPTMWRRVLTLPDIESYDLASLRLLLTGGEPIPVPVLREVYRRFPGAGFINTYGSTEGGPITTFLSTADASRMIGSVGKPAFGVEVRIADDDSNAVPQGHTGELLVRSPFVCGGYWERPEMTAASFREGWWHSGDFARQDDHGFIWIAGRKKDMIISGAENIYPGEVEAVLAEIDGVVEAAVVGVPDPEWGEAVAAYVVRRDENSVTEDIILDHCRGNLAGYKKPRHIRFVEALPRTGVNKISRNALRDLFGGEPGH
jgi:fatty-acyl-CoA synthase